MEQKGDIILNVIVTLVRLKTSFKLLQLIYEQKLEEQ